MRRVSCDTDRRSDDGAGAHGSLSALSRAMRGCGRHDAGDYTERCVTAAAVAPRIAVVGASSLIGEAVIDELDARRFAGAELHALDDERRLGRPLASDASASDVARFD